MPSIYSHIVRSNSRRSYQRAARGSISGECVLPMLELSLLTGLRITLEKPPHLVMHFGMTGKNDAYG